MKITYLFPIIIIFAASCHKNTFDFINEYERSEKIYYGNNMVLAQKSLSYFISQSEANEIEARKTKGVVYHMGLAMACLRMASICAIKGDSDCSEAYMNKAIVYFDQEPSFANDVNYIKDKKAVLINFLDKIESSIRPEWKKVFNQRANQ